MICLSALRQVADVGMVFISHIRGTVREHMVMVVAIQKLTI